MPNQLKARLKAGETCINAWSMMPSMAAVELLAQTGWDSVTLDMQHGLFDYASAVACIQAMQAHPVTPLVRVPWNEPGVIGKVLDAGAWGLICPMVNNAEDAAALARASLYLPLGQRSYGPIRAAAYGGATPYHQTANDELLILPMVETVEAVANIADILDTPGLSGIYIGPADLGLSMGLAPVLDREEPEVLRIYEALLEQVTKRGLVAGIQNGTPAYAARMSAMGFRLVTVNSDVMLLAQSARQTVAATRAALAATAREPAR